MGLGTQPSFEAGVVLYEMAMGGAMPLASYPEYRQFQGRPEFGTNGFVKSPRHTLQAISGVVRFRSTLWFLPADSSWDIVISLPNLKLPLVAM